MSQTPLRFKPAQHDNFIKTLRKRVNEYFTQQNTNQYANTEMVIKSIVLISFWIGSYVLVVATNVSPLLKYIQWVLLGLSVALVTVNVGHDAIHGSFSRKKWINALLSHTFNLNGASAYMWTKMHNGAHHTYTNVHGYDEDIESLPILRLSPETKLKKIHKHQYWYSFLFYGLATLSWVFIKDYVKFFKNSVGNYNNKKHPKKEYFYLFFYKFTYYFLFIVVPFLTLDLAWYHILLGFLLSHFVEGFYLAVVFMLAHVVEDTHFPMPSTEGSIENTWAIHQLYTTANFSSKSRLMFYLTGGLNLQVEHHLFPNICSIHYMPLAQIVHETAHEFGLPYINYEKFGGAFVSHIRFLKEIGRIDRYKPVLRKQFLPVS